MSSVAVFSGPVTFVFTDIEGSTHLWELHPAAMQSVMARHDAILRHAIESSNGAIVKTTGDGVHAAFNTTANAIAATATAQQALLADPWEEIKPNRLNVRMSIHTGEALARAGDYYGASPNRAARLMSIASGGQVLVSAATAELVRDSLPAGVTLRDLGEHRLKDLVRPEHVYQLVHALLPGDFPPLKSLDAYPNNLPIQLTSFIGREREIDETKLLLTSSRLVTLTGSGGTGKTRLALQASAETLQQFADGAWFIELAPVTDPNGVVAAVATALGLRDVPGITLRDLVRTWLRTKCLLLILDNCEHVIDACAQLADELLRSCSHLNILASSRESLGIAGEASYRVPSLSLPGLDDKSSARILESEAGQLFVDRARAANSRFALTESNASAVTAICHRLDGIPLALELAAARSKLFSADQIAERLSDRFRLLTGGSRTALPRQQTLRAMIDWSHNLLSEPESILMRRLSVFSGGWTFEAAETICTDLDVLDLLEQLVNKSLVVVDEHYGQARYHMLETIRQYAREKLFDAGEGVIMRDRHLDYYVQYAQAAEPQLRNLRSSHDWYNRLDAEHDNNNAAIEWGRDRRPEDVLVMIGSIYSYLSLRSENRMLTLNLVSSLLDRLASSRVEGIEPTRRKRARAHGLAAAGLLAMGLGETPAAQDYFSQAAQLERELGEKFYLAFALGIMASLGIMTGDFASTYTYAGESASIFRELQEDEYLIMALPLLATMESRKGNRELAKKYRDEISRLIHVVDHPFFVTSLLGMGLDARFRRQPGEAREYFTEGLRIAQHIRSPHFVTVMESELAHIDRDEGKLRSAKSAYMRLIFKWRDYGQHSAVANLLECFAFITHQEHENRRAASLLGAAEALRDQIHIDMRHDERMEYEPVVVSLREALGDSVFEAAWSQGRNMDMDRAIQYAISVEPQAVWPVEK